METLLGKMLGDLATLVGEKWWAGMGLVGLIGLFWVLLNEIPGRDDLLVGLVFATMMFFGFAEGEVRTFQKSYYFDRRGLGSIDELTRPARRFNTPSILLMLGGTISGGCAIARLVGWL